MTEKQNLYCITGFASLQDILSQQPCRLDKSDGHATIIAWKHHAPKYAALSQTSAVQPLQEDTASCTLVDSSS